MGIATIGKFLIVLPKLVFKYWYVLAFLMFVLPPVVQSISAGINGEDWGTPLRDGGRYLISQDVIIYEYVLDLEYESPKEGGDKFDYIFNFWVSMLLNIGKAVAGMFFLFMMLFRGMLILQDNTSKTRSAVFKAIGIMVILQIIVLGIPFKGAYSLIKFIIFEVIL